jgi:hypothetical protein
MKGRYILAAAHGWDGDSANHPLPIMIPDGKLQEIHMIPLPLPPTHQLSFNVLLLPENPAIIHAWVTTWQERSRMLSAWICKVKVNSYRYPNTWTWPVSPLAPVPFDEDQSDSSKSMELGSTTTEDNHSLAATSFSEDTNPSSQVARTFSAHAESIPIKHARDSSPLDPQCDGDDPSKKQVVLWNLSISQLLDLYHLVVRGHFDPSAAGMHIPITPPSSPTSSLVPDAPIPSSSSAQSLIRSRPSFHPQRLFDPQPCWTFQGVRCVEIRFKNIWRGDYVWEPAFLLTCMLYGHF